MNGRFQMQGGRNRILPKDMNANRFFWDSHWLEMWSNHFCPSMGPNGTVEMDSGCMSSCFSGECVTRSNSNILNKLDSSRLKQKTFLAF